MPDRPRPRLIGPMRVLLVLLAVVAGLFAAEGMARLAAPYPMVTPWMDQIDGSIAPLPNVHGRHFVPGLYDTTFSFTEQRFRGRQLYTPQPGPHVLRIAAVGASFTFGSGANDVDSYPFRLQAILQQQSSKLGWDRSIEVINAGIPGSVTAEQALWYERGVEAFHPDVVILDVSCAVDHLTGLFQLDQDGRAVPRPKEVAQTAGGETLAVRQLVHRFPGLLFLSEHSEAYNLFRVFEGEVLRRNRDSALGAGAAVHDPTNPPDDLLQQELRFQTAEITWLKNKVEQSGATFAIVVLPCRENIYPSRSQWAPRIRKEYPLVVNAMRDLSAAEGIPFAELSSGLQEKAAGSQPLYYDGKFETHPTPAGYQAIAEGIAAFLVERAIVPGNCGSRCSGTQAAAP